MLVGRRPFGIDTTLHPAALEYAVILVQQVRTLDLLAWNKARVACILDLDAAQREIAANCVLSNQKYCQSHR